MLAEATKAASEASGIVATLQRAAAATGADFNYLLATAEVPKETDVLTTYLSRPAEGGPRLRICLTPTLAYNTGMAQNKDLTPRYYEKL